MEGDAGDGEVYNVSCVYCHIYYIQRPSNNTVLLEMILQTSFVPCCNKKATNIVLSRFVHAGKAISHLLLCYSYLLIFLSLMIHIYSGCDIFITRSSNSGFIPLKDGVLL